MSDTVLKSLIQSVKSKPELSMVTCIYGNRRELSQNPNCSFVLSFETEKVNLSRDKRQDFLFEKEYKLSLLAPSGASGKRLSEVALWVSEALQEAATDGVVKSIIIEKQQYSDTTAVLYSDIYVVVGDIAHSKLCSVYFNDKLQTGITEVNFRSAETSEKTGELLNGYHEVKENYITISIQSKNSLSVPAYPFELMLESEESRDVFVNCVIVSERFVQNMAEGISYSYEIKGERKNADV
ncbi:MAG: hypothetical protein E7532_01985 [Ruminococcaceae bacterium]|nr:hypothetical protein [Oscillospiraceae bacterium]